jgi:REP element-mobilizing transposase RayT
MKTPSIQSSAQCHPHTPCADSGNFEGTPPTEFDTDVFAFYDRTQPVFVTEGRLPHWFQPGVTYFVTFRTDDSVPAALASQWHRHRIEWLTARGIDPSAPDVGARIAGLPTRDHQAYHRTFTKPFLDYLDRGAGACPLRRPECAAEVNESLMHFDYVRYVISDFVVMPNHVHVLVALRGESTIEGVCYSWKKFTAGRINAILGTRGRFWQEESFDHLIRSAEQFNYLRQYIAANPSKAGLSKGEYRHYHRKINKSGAGERPETDLSEVAGVGTRCVPTTLSSAHSVCGQQRQSD